VWLVLGTNLAANGRFLIPPGGNDLRAPQDTIAFISTYDHPSRDSIERTVQAAFPEYRVRNVWLRDIIKRHAGWIAPNLWYVGKEYGLASFASRTALRGKYFRTTYLFRRIRDAMREVIDPSRDVFSFQTQSLCDASVPGVAHFAYTDHTHLSNLRSPYFQRRNLRPAPWIALERSVYANARCVFTRSQHVAEDVVRHYGIEPSRVSCVFAGSNVPIDDDFRPRNNGYANRTVLFVGGDWERKGGPELARAFEQVLRVYPDARLIVAGARPDLTLRNCTVLGHVTPEELTKLYAGASVFCVPTRLEPFGIVFIEAMMHRLPVIATRVGAVPEMVDDGVSGKLVQPGDAAALAAALTSLLGDAERCRSQGEAGYRRALATYTWERVGERLRARIMPEITRSDRASLADAPTALLGCSAPSGSIEAGASAPQRPAL
jgi:glycosyltransferase involved in cell wall biosynthesis